MNFSCDVKCWSFLMTFPHDTITSRQARRILRKMAMYHQCRLRCAKSIYEKSFTHTVVVAYEVPDKSHAPLHIRSNRKEKQFAFRFLCHFAFSCEARVQVFQYTNKIAFFRFLRESVKNDSLKNASIISILLQIILQLTFYRIFF